MSKICANCGTALEEDARFCQSCGSEQPDISVSVFQPVNAEQPMQQTPVWQQPVQQPMQPEKPKKSKKKLALIGGIAAAVVALALVFILVILPMIKGGKCADAQNTLLFSKGGADYYVPFNVFKLNGDGDPSIVTVTYSDGSTLKPARIYYNNAARDGDTIYTFYGLDRTMYKITVTGETAMSGEDWMKKEDFDNNAFSALVDDWSFSMCNLACDGDYLYFNIVSGPDRRLTQGSIEYKMGKISLETKEISIIDGISAVDFIVHDGWIYYIDSGYYFNDQTGLSGKMDQSRVGVYKARPDGSDKTLLRSLRWENSDGYHFGIADELSLVDGKLFYTDYSVEGKGRICRMSPDGGDVEYVSNSPAYHYVVDNEHSKVYYITSSYNGYSGAGEVLMEPNFICYDCSAGTETSIPYPKRYFAYMSMTYHDGYIYFANASGFRYGSYGEGISICGMRMNVSTEKFRYLIGYNDGEMVDKIDPTTGRKRGVEFKEGEDHLYWEDVPDNNMIGL